MSKKQTLKEKLQKVLNKEISSGNILSKGKGVCKCVYRKDGTRMGMCLRCANYNLHAHRQGELKAYKRIELLLLGWEE